MAHIKDKDICVDFPIGTARIIPQYWYKENTVAGDTL